MTVLELPDHRRRRPRRHRPPPPPQRRRKLGGAPAGTVSTWSGPPPAGRERHRSCCTRLTALSGPLGLVFVAYVAFVVIYARPGVPRRRRPGGRRRGDDGADGHLPRCSPSAPWPSWSSSPWPGAGPPSVHLNFYTQDMSTAGPLAPLTGGAWATPWSGPLWMVGIAVVLTVPIGLVAAVYLDMTRSRPARFFRTVVEAMTALPSILAGLFIYASVDPDPRLRAQSGLAAALALSVMMLPYIIRASDLALRLVPGNLREAVGRARGPGVAGRVAGGPPHGPLGPGHRRHPGHRPRHRRGLTRPADRRRTPPTSTPIRCTGRWSSLPLAALKLVQSGSTRVHRPGLRLRLVPPPAGHRPLRDGPEGRRLGPRPPVRPGTARVREASARDVARLRPTRAAPRDRRMPTGRPDAVQSHRPGAPVTDRRHRRPPLRAARAVAVAARRGRSCAVIAVVAGGAAPAGATLRPRRRRGLVVVGQRPRPVDRRRARRRDADQLHGQRIDRPAARTSSTGRPTSPPRTSRSRPTRATVRRPSTPSPAATPTCRSRPAARSSCTTSRSTASG